MNNDHFEKLQHWPTKNKGQTCLPPIDPPPLLLAKTEEKNSTQRFLFPYQFLIC